MSELFVSTDARCACPRGVIGSTMDTYHRGTGSNPVEGNGHFFPSCRQLYLSSFSDTHTHTHTHTRMRMHMHTQVNSVSYSSQFTCIFPKHITCNCLVCRQESAYFDLLFFFTSVSAGANMYSESETIAKYEIMDGAPVRGKVLDK